jgi:hypothetical protein
MAQQPVLVLHTTEGWSLESAKRTLKANNSWSHWGCDPKTREFETFINPDRDGDGVPDRGARSLRNLSGGVETNHRGGVLQIEIVGFADKVVRDQYDDGWWWTLARWIEDICDSYGVPKVFPYKFLGSEAYGLQGKARLTNRQWLEVSGIIGHQHVPENTHWDPGPMDRRLKSLIPGGTKVDTWVEKSQQALIDAGYPMEPFGADGEWGSKSHAALVQALRERDTNAENLVQCLNTSTKAQEAIVAISEALAEWRKLSG